MSETRSEQRLLYEGYLGRALRNVSRAAELADTVQWVGEVEDLEQLLVELQRLLYDSVSGRRRKLRRQPREG